MAKQAMQGHGGLLAGILIGGAAVYLFDHLHKHHMRHGGHRHPKWHRGCNMCSHPTHRLHSHLIEEEMRGGDPNIVRLGPEEDLELSLGENGGRSSKYIGFGGGEAFAGAARANVGYLPGDRLAFNDYLDDRWITSEVWDRRTSVYKNDGVIYNTVGAVFTEPTTDFHPEKRLGIAGAYGSGTEDSPRPRQQHIGGNYPMCLGTGSESNC